VPTIAPTSASTRRRAAACRRKFLEFFPDGFNDEVFLDTERAYKWIAHRQWVEAFGGGRLSALVAGGRFEDVARQAVRIESRTNLLFSFEKMALRDAVASPQGARRFALGLSEWLEPVGSHASSFERWADVVRGLPRRQTRVATWPVLTVFGFLARPKSHLYVKPTIMRRAAEAYGFDFDYSPTASWRTYSSALDFARTVRRDLTDLRPRDMIDIQSFLWVLGSSEYDG
jgi:hypothetical protein